jgi:hypothetical protein
LGAVFLCDFISVTPTSFATARLLLVLEIGQNDPHYYRRMTSRVTLTKMSLPSNRIRVFAIYVNFSDMVFRICPESGDTIHIGGSCGLSNA